jgi:hypothetical protein
MMGWKEIFAVSLIILVSEIHSEQCEKDNAIKIGVKNMNK